MSQKRKRSESDASSSSEDEGEEHENIVELEDVDDATSRLEVRENVSNESNQKGGKVLKPMSSKKMKKYMKAQEQRGIIYISRIPPFLTPEKVRHLLSVYGEIDRIFLTPEGERVRRKRKKFYGKKRKCFVDGWVEFLDKDIAKSVAISLNNTPVESKKRSMYHDDMWNMKYMKGLKWTHITEKMARERASRGKKLRHEISIAKKQNNIYLQRADHSKSVGKMVERKAKSGKAVKPLHDPENAKRVVKQKQPIASKETALTDVSDLKIFG